MPASTKISFLLDRLLPAQVPAAPRRADDVRRLYAGIGLPSQRGFSGRPPPLVARLEEAPAALTVYRDLRDQALAGSTAALNDLAWVWLNGKYWPADHALARRLLRMAAAQGSAEAFFNLGQQQYFGKGVEISYPSARHDYERAFALGLVEAAAALGDLYLEERCPAEPGPEKFACADRSLDWPTDPAQACAWFLRGAEQGDPRCRFEIGYCLLYGHHLPCDVPAGLYWLELAAVAGVMAAAEELAVYHSLSSSTLRYLFWRDRAVALGSRLALDMQLADVPLPL